MRVAVPTLIAALLLIAGCGDGNDIDSTPEDTAGRESTEFESEDIEAAEGAGRLVELYCEPVESEAQEVGCLSHVSEDDVCSQDTDARRDAVEAYRDETGDDPC